jgi:hypothetical protein
MYREAKPIFPPYGSHAERRESRIFRIEHYIYLLGYGSWWPLELMFLESPLRRLLLKGTVSKWTLCETAQRSADGLQDHPTVHDENHEKTQHAAQDDGRDLAVLDVYPDEHEALDRQDRGEPIGDSSLVKKANP